MWRQPDARAPLGEIFPRTFSSPKQNTCAPAIQHKTYKPQLKGDIEAIYTAVDLISKAKNRYFIPVAGL
ncbi:MAG: hypothetical protein CM15mP21_0510 [Hyphomicrobiales bacterium]|nr:MAG: hypothetical protein CM15mP21_0510 [Hyphomicrobiales bacterium]